MKKVDLPQSRFSDFRGMWVAIQDERIVAVAQELKELSSLVVGTKKHPPKASALKVPPQGLGGEMKKR